MIPLTARSKERIMSRKIGNAFALLNTGLIKATISYNITGKAMINPEKSEVLNATSNPPAGEV
jgi:hypothetical protein